MKFFGTLFLLFIILVLSILILEGIHGTGCQKEETNLTDEWGYDSSDEDWDFHKEDFKIKETTIDTSQRTSTDSIDYHIREAVNGTLDEISRFFKDLKVE